MVVGKLMHLPLGSSTLAPTGVVGSGSNNALEYYEIRSGMSVQDLKQLTAQRQCMAWWEHQQQQHARQLSPESTSSTSSTSSSSSLDSPLRYPTNNNARFATYTPTRSSAPHYGGGGGGYGGGYSHGHGSQYALQSPGSPTDRMFVTCGGQVVSFMDGVVNAPQIDCLPDMLGPL